MFKSKTGRKLCIKIALYFSVRHGQYVKVLQKIVEKLVKKDKCYVQVMN